MTWLKVLLLIVLNPLFKLPMWLAVLPIEELDLEATSCVWVWVCKIGDKLEKMKDKIWLILHHLAQPLLSPPTPSPLCTNTKVIFGVLSYKMVPMIKREMCHHYR